MPDASQAAAGPAGTSQSSATVLTSSQSLAYLSAAFIAISLWEYIIWLPNEIHAWRKAFGFIKDSQGHKVKITFGEAIAIYIRYSLMAVVFAVALLDYGRPAHCGATAILTWVFSTMAWAGVSMLFTLRVYIMFQRSRFILCLFGFLWCVCLAIWILVTASWRARNAPDEVPAGAPWCKQSNDKSYRTANWGAEMGFDLCVLVATLIRLRQLSKTGADNGSSRRMRSFILRSNLGYFAISFILSLAAFITQEVVQDVVLSQVMTPPTITLAPVVAIRIVFSATNDATIEESRPYYDDDKPRNRHSQLESNPSHAEKHQYQQRKLQEDDGLSAIEPSRQEAQDLADMIYRSNNSMPTYQIQTVQRKSPPDHAVAQRNAAASTDFTNSPSSKAARLLNGNASNDNIIHQVHRIPATYDSQSFQRSHSPNSSTLNSDKL